MVRCSAPFAAKNASKVSSLVQSYFLPLVALPAPLHLGFGTAGLLGCRLWRQCDWLPVLPTTTGSTCGMESTVGHV